MRPTRGHTGTGTRFAPHSTAIGDADSSRPPASSARPTLTRALVTVEPLVRACQTRSTRSGRRYDHIRHSMTKLTIAAVNDLDLAGGAERLRLVARADRQSEVPSAGVYVTSAVGGMYISRSAIAVPLCSYVCDAVLKVVTSATVGIASLLGRRTRSPGDM